MITNPFYLSYKWKKKRREVLAMDRNECQICKAKGKYRNATHVHHVKHLEDHPELGLEVWYFEDGVKKRNLLSVCKECHETVCHPERLRWNKKEPLNEERW